MNAIDMKIMQFCNYLKYPRYLFSIVNNLLLILIVSTIKEMVFIPDDKAR